MTDDLSRGLEAGQCGVSRAESSGELRRRVWRGARGTTIGDFPDNILLDIFDFCRISSMLSENAYFVWEWNILAHVCRYWRQVLFASPRRLGLQLRCTPVTPVREMLDIWPTLPIHIQKPAYLQFHPKADYDNVIVALEHHDLVSVINIDALTRRQLGRVVAVMQKPFPALTHLHLRSTDEAAQALPDTFMGGSAPRLQVLRLEGISFPTLPSLILSPTGLTTLNLYAIPSGGYILPGEMVTFLSPFTRLEDLVIEFKSPSPPPDPASRLVTPSIRALLPALKYFRFKGISEYLEDIAAQIDAPLLSNFGATIFNQAILPSRGSPVSSSALRRSFRSIKWNCPLTVAIFGSSFLIEAMMITTSRSMSHAAHRIGSCHPSFNSVAHPYFSPLV